MRNLYETPDHLTDEARIRDAIEQAWDCKAIKLDLSGFDGSLDYQLIRQKRQAFAELKHRNSAFGHYPTYMISMKKVYAAERHKLEQSAPSFMVIEFIDRIYWAPFDAEYVVSTGGRRDREDPYDLEQCAFYPIEHFRELRRGAR